MDRDPMRISTDTRLDGHTDRDVTIDDGAQLQQHAQLDGDVRVLAGGRLEQHGPITGDIRVYASAEVYGQIDGELYAYPGSDVIVREGAMVGRKVRRYVTPDGRFEEVPRTGDFTTSSGARRCRLHPDGSLTGARATTGRQHSRPSVLRDHR